jgi:NAD(P)-dependent dehydrogenase (short-subunit alcohol dehydrogenase family)
MSVAIVTGASRGLGRALAVALAERGWSLVIDARGAGALGEVARELEANGAEANGAEASGIVVAIPGDVADESHRRALVEAAEELGGIDLLVNNASVLGPSPQPKLREYPLQTLEDVFRVNAIAPLALFQLAAGTLAKNSGSVVNITSDAGVEGYEGWGGYGASKAALEQLSRVLAAEHPEIRVYWVDPGDMNTQMHQQAYPGEDISDRSPPEASVPGLLEVIEGALPSGRYRTADHLHQEASR